MCGDSSSEGRACEIRPRLHSFCKGWSCGLTFIRGVLNSPVPGAPRFPVFGLPTNGRTEDVQPVSPGHGDSHRRWVTSRVHVRKALEVSVQKVLWA